MPAPSYSHGTSDTPLLGDTIGANFERTAARFPTAPPSSAATRTCG